MADVEMTDAAAAAAAATEQASAGKFRFSIDRGGTFTDVYAEVPVVSGQPPFRVLKLLSEDPAHYADAPREAIRRVLEEVTGRPHPIDQPLDTRRIEWIRMGTTVATNALLERKGERTAFVTTQGFKDLLHIGNQSRAKIFDLEIARPENVYEQVVEVEERVLVETQKEGGKIWRDEEWEGKFTQVQGVTGEMVTILQAPNMEKLEADLRRVKEMGIVSLAVSLAHAYTFAAHEQQVGELARTLGFTHISLSSALMPMVKLVPRSYTACADAYLTPCIHKYLTQFRKGFDADMEKNTRVWFMQSDGGLVPVDKFSGFRAVLSGPAGGVVGYAQVTPIQPRSSKEDEEQAMQEGEQETRVEDSSATSPPVRSRAEQYSIAQEAVIGFDMGGTSTDVSRFSGQYEHIFENTSVKSATSYCIHA
jgi:5-oxoprolinase (ATP-hydrolysing)